MQRPKEEGSRGSAKQHKIWRAIGPVNNARTPQIKDTLKPNQFSD